MGGQGKTAISYQKDRRHDQPERPDCQAAPRRRARPGAGVATTLPYDQIPPERHSIGGFTGRLDEHNGVLGVAHAQWMARDDSKTEPDIRRAGDPAMDAIDALLRKLLALRSRPAAPRVRRLRDGPEEGDSA